MNWDVEFELIFSTVLSPVRFFKMLGMLIVLVRDFLVRVSYGKDARAWELIVGMLVQDGSRLGYEIIQDYFVFGPRCDGKPQDAAFSVPVTRQFSVTRQTLHLHKHAFFILSFDAFLLHLLPASWINWQRTHTLLTAHRKNQVPNWQQTPSCFICSSQESVEISVIKGFAATQTPYLHHQRPLPLRNAPSPPPGVLTSVY